MQVNEIVTVSVNLATTPASQANFAVSMLLSDTDEIPVDQRYIIATRSSYQTQFTSGTDHYSWLQTLWGQNGNPRYAYLGRWISAATGPYFVANGASEVYATWALVSDGTCTVTSDAGADILTGLDFTGVTDMAGVAAAFQTEITAGGVSGVLCTVDTLGRLLFSDPVADGSGVNTVVVTASGAGTDVTSATYLDIATGFAQEGLAIEALDTALSEILEVDNTPFGVSERGATIAQQVAFAAAVQARDKIYVPALVDTDTKDGSSTTDAGYLIKDGGYNHVYSTYTEHTDNNPDAAIFGQVFTNFPGSSNMALYPLAAVSESGLAGDAVSSTPLTPTERAALKAKGVDYLVRPVSQTHFVNGLTPDGTEVRIIIAKMWLSITVAENIYAYLIANQVVTYSTDDLNAIKAIIQTQADKLVDVGLLDPDSYAWDMPSPSDFTRAVQATHTMTLTNVWSANTLNAVNDVILSLTFNV